MPLGVELSQRKDWWTLVWALKGNKHLLCYVTEIIYDVLEQTKLLLLTDRDYQKVLNEGGRFLKGQDMCRCNIARSSRQRTYVDKYTS